MNSLRLYFRYVDVSIKSQLQYGTSVLLQTLGQGLTMLMEFGGVWVLFNRFGQLRGWTLPEAAMFYGTVSITFAISDAMATGFDRFGQMVKAGDFDRLLVRPRSTVLQLLGHEVTLRRAGRLVQGLAVFAWAARRLDLDFSLATVTPLLMAIAGGVCVFFGLVMLQASMAFWTTESLEVWNAFTYGGVSMSQYPLAIYRSWFRTFFTYIIPLGCVSYYPVVAVLGRVDPLGSGRLFQWMAPLAGPMFLTLAVQVWRIGVRHYRSTGS